MDRTAFYKRVRRTRSGCWLWPTAARYGCIALPDRRKVSAHRMAYELFHGPIPAGLLVRHKCDTPACVRPDHLMIGTQLDNRRDAVERGRTARGERNAAAKLTDEQFAAIPKRVAAGERQADIAREFGVTRQAICQYLKRHAAGLDR